MVIELCFLFLATHLQQRSTGATTVGGQPWHNGNLSQSSPAKQQQIRLQLLQYERDRLRIRQQEIRQQEIRMQQEITMRSSSADMPLDPFLTGLNDHSRQESADSGLGKIFNMNMKYRIRFHLLWYK